MDSTIQEIEKELELLNDELELTILIDSYKKESTNIKEIRRLIKLAEKSLLRVKNLKTLNVK
jgi:hypothetical protein